MTTPKRLGEDLDLLTGRREGKGREGCGVGVGVGVGVGWLGANRASPVSPGEAKTCQQKLTI